MKKIKQKIQSIGKTALTVGALIILFPLLSFVLLKSPNYVIKIGTFALIYMIAVSGLDILYGYCGQISMGHAGFFAIGAYGSALLNMYADIPVFFSALISCIVASLIGAVLAYPAAKLRFHFLSLATIAFGEIVRAFIQASPGEITGNMRGIFPQKIVICGINISGQYDLYYYLVLIILCIALLIKQRIVNSKTGRAFIAIRENPVAANGMGVNVRKYKIIAFSISAFYVALAGALYGHFVNYISPSTFTYDQSVLFMTMLLFGGSGCFWGPIAGAAAVQIMNELLRAFERYQTLFYGVLILIVVLFMPNGIVKINLERIKSRGFSRKK